MAKTDKPEKNTNKNTNKDKRHFWKDFKAELKKVIWPTRSQVINNTIIVIVIVLIVTAICFVLDLAFEALNTYGIDNLKTMVQNSVSSTDNGEDTNTVENNDSSAENTTNPETNEIIDASGDSENSGENNSSEGETNNEAQNDEASN